MPNGRAQVSARFAGQIRAVNHSVGDTVKAGATLALVESNESLQTYAVTRADSRNASSSGDANPGETAGRRAAVRHRRLPQPLGGTHRCSRVTLPASRLGQRVRVQAADGHIEGEGRVLRVAPSAAAGAGISGLYTARVALDNADGRWVPGLFVQGNVRIGEAAGSAGGAGAPACRPSGTSPSCSRRSVRPTKCACSNSGREDETWVEVLGGLKPGTRYVARRTVT